MSKIVLASHGELALGMLNSVSMIVGDLANDIKAYSLYPGESPNDMFCKIEKEVISCDEQFFILCDIKGGSVHTTLSKLIVYPNVSVISGLNMNMVLDIMLTYQSMEFEQIDMFLESAKEGITLLRNEIIKTVDEDF